VAFFGGPQGFSESELTTFGDGDTGLCFDIVDVESPSIYFGFQGVGDVVPQLGGLLVVLLVDVEKVLSHQLYGGASSLRLQGFYMAILGGVVLLWQWEESHRCTQDGLIIDLAQVLQALTGDSLVGVGEAEFDCSHAPVIDDVGEVFALGDVDSDLATLNILLVVLSAFILGVLFDYESLHGGIKELGEIVGVEKVAASLGTFGHLASLVVMVVEGKRGSCSHKKGVSGKG
jgi:hypothetical protein